MTRLRCLCAALVTSFVMLACAGVGADGCNPRHVASPQFVAADCKFQNLANPAAKPSRGGWEIWTRFLTEKKVDTVPVQPIPVRPLDRSALDKLDNESNHVVRLGHSSHLLKLRGKYWLIDPVFGDRASPVSWAGPLRFHPSPLPLDEVPPIEGLILSHDHYDHLDALTIEALKNRVQRYFVPLGVGEHLRGMGVPADRIEEFDWWREAKHGDVGLTATPAQHFSGRTLWDRDKTLWASWVIHSGNERIFYSGDGGYFGGFKEIGEKLGPFDLALMENGAYDSHWPAVHMTPEETVRAFKDVKAKTLYLVHNSTFDLAFHPWREPLERVAQLAEQQGLPLATPEIGEVLTLGQPRENKLWWRGMN